MAHMESTCTPSASNPALRSGVQRSVFFPARALDRSPCHLAPGSRPAAGPGSGARAHQQPPRRPRLCGSLDSLHSGGLVGTQRACGQGGCGACTVHIVDDRGKATPVNACLIEADGHARRETGAISKRRRHQRSATAEAGTGGVPLRSCTAVCMQCVTSSRLFWYERCAGLLLLVQLAPRNALATTLSNKLFCGARRVD